jgi:hypothetical protein
MDREAGGRFFRNEWIQGVNAHFPGTPKPGYIAPWEAISAWEQDSAMEVYQQVHAVVAAGSERESHLNREQGGRIIRLAWVGQIYRHIPDPKPSYVCAWEEMPAWEQAVDMDIFEAIQAQ